MGYVMCCGKEKSERHGDLEIVSCNTTIFIDSLAKLTNFKVQFPMDYDIKGFYNSYVRRLMSLVKL